jgi:hypothetical protein
LAQSLHTLVRYKWHPRKHLHRTPKRIANSRPIPGGFVAFGPLRQLHHRRDLPLQLHHKAAAGLARLDPHSLDQPARDLQRLVARGGVCQRLVQRRDLPRIELGEVGMEARGRGLSLGASSRSSAALRLSRASSLACSPGAAQRSRGDTGSLN